MRHLLTALLVVASSGALQAQTADTVRLSLGEAARTAAQQNTQVVEARLRVEQARARVSYQRGALLPQVSGQVIQSTHTMNTATFGLDFPTPPGEPPLFDPNGEIIGPIRLSDARGRVSQTLFDMSALRRVRGASAAADAADAQAEAAAQRAAATAATAYVQALRAQQLYNNRRADVELAGELARIATEQLESGTGVRLDVTRAEALRAVVNAQAVSARNALERARLTLARALGMPAGTTVVLTDSLPTSLGAEPDAQAAMQLAQAKRADVRALDAQIRSAELQAAATRGERLPTLNFVADDGWIGKNWDHMLHTYDWAVQLSVPVFTGFRARAREQEQRAIVSELEARRHDLQDQLAFDVHAALLDESGAREQVDAAVTGLRLAEQELTDARDRYEAGVAGSADVITASQRLNAARTAHSEALAAYQSARVALAAAQGNVTELP